MKAKKSILTMLFALVCTVVMGAMLPGVMASAKTYESKKIYNVLDIYENGSFSAYVDGSNYFTIIGTDGKALICTTGDEYESEYRSDAYYANGKYVLGNNLYSSKGKLLHTFKNAGRVFYAGSRILYIEEKIAAITTTEGCSKFILNICNEKYKVVSKFEIDANTYYSLCNLHIDTVKKVAKNIYFVGSEYCSGGSLEGGYLINVSRKKVIASPVVYDGANKSWKYTQSEYSELYSFLGITLDVSEKKVDFSKIKSSEDWGTLYFGELTEKEWAKVNKAGSEVEKAKLALKLLTIKKDKNNLFKATYKQLYRGKTVKITLSYKDGAYASDVMVNGVKLPYYSNTDVLTRVKDVDESGNILLYVRDVNGQDYYTVVNSKGKMLYDPIQPAGSIVTLHNGILYYSDRSTAELMAVTKKGAIKKASEINAKSLNFYSTFSYYYSAFARGVGNTFYIATSSGYGTLNIINSKGVTKISEVKIAV